ncbi:IclR family transcriptional regulator [Victivallis vadensis]|uniref:IclR family transcriptional regulator n=1 Tax=Victivallis vadensis TaxID=172901 RepID=UPI00266D7141|nr:IclR family transcriptional regulator [Victivallis vadensis]
MSEKRYSAPAAASTLEVLEFMASNPGAWGPTELARRLELSPNLVFRVLNILQEKGYVKRNPAGQYELTAGLYSLGMKLQNNFELRKQARPFLETLAAETGESCQIQIPAGDRMLQLDFVPPPADYYLAVTPGIRLYRHGNAFGKAVLAFLPPEEHEMLFAVPLPRLTPHTIVDPVRLREEFAEIRRTRSASEFDEYVLGSYCIGSPVFNALGKPVAGVGITGLSSRLCRERLPELRQFVLSCAENISKSIGYQEVQ